MIRRISLVAIATLLAVTLVSAAVDVTFVLKNGQRESGQLFYHANLGDIGLLQGGRERMISFDDIAVLAFEGGDPSREELDRLPRSDNPPELERHMLVLKNGETLPGKFYGFGGDHVIFDVRNSSGGPDRRNFNFNDVKRLYFSGAGARSVYSNVLGGAPSSTPSGQEREIRVEANRPWTSTGISVGRGERVSFQATGEIMIGTDVMATPDGNPDLARRMTYPVRAMGAGGLIGRVGNGAPFAIGSNTNAIVMPAAGELRLGINDDRFNDNTGWFTVKIRR